MKAEAERNVHFSTSVDGNRKKMVLAGDDFMKK